MHPLPEARALARAWEAQSSLRSRLADDQAPYLTRWVNNLAIGVPSCQAMGLNVAALEALAAVWCPLTNYARPLPIDYVRSEACVEATKPTPVGLTNSESVLVLKEFFHIVPLQVRQLRTLAGKPLDPALIQLDAAGLKQLFSRGIRRFCAQPESIREPLT